MNGEYVIKELAKGVYLLSSNRILNTNTQSIYTPDYLWLLEEDNMSINLAGVVIRVARSFNDILLKEKNTRMILFVYCWDIILKKKIKYAELHDNFTHVEYPIEGSRHIIDTWIEFNYQFQAKKAYKLLIRCDNDFPFGFEIVDYKAIK